MQGITPNFSPLYKGAIVFPSITVLLLAPILRAVFVRSRENFFDTFKSFLCVDAVLKFKHVSWLAEAFRFAIFPFALDFDAVVNHAA